MTSRPGPPSHARQGQVDAGAAWVAERFLDRPPVAPAIAVFLGAYAASSVVLLTVGLVVSEWAWVHESIRSFDRDVLVSVAGAGPDAFATAFDHLSTLVDTWTVVGVLVGALSVLGALRRWTQVVVLAVATGTELLVFLTVTFLVARPRPDLASGMVPMTGSYPSGHAAMAVALYGGLALVVGSLDGRRSVRRAASAAAVVLALGVGASRMYLAVHYPSDVVVGWVLGAASLVAAVVAARAMAVRAIREAHQPTPRRPPSLRRRALAAGVAAVVALAAWTVIVEPRVLLAVQHEDAELPGLPASWEGERIGVIADLQIGMWLDNVGMARRAVEELVDGAPATVLILGDFVYGDDDTHEKVRTAVEVVRPLTEAGIPTFAVLGNHDHASGAAPLLTDRLTEIGIEVLVNEAIPLTRGGEELYVVGIGSNRADRAVPAEALAGVPEAAARVVMMHNPATFDRLDAGAAPLAVAGHTHGGQVRVPFTPEWSWLRFAQDHPVHADGWIDGYGSPGNELFVNRGIGMSVLPIRFSCTPAITLFTLQPAK